MINQVFDHWNSKPKHPKWRHHSKITTKMTNAISERLQEWSADDLCEMIDNFYLCKTDKRFKINRNNDWPKWTLSEFFTRGCGGKDDKGLRCEWFAPEEFDEERQYTDSYRKQLREQHRPTAQEEPVQLAEAVDYEQLALDNPDNNFYREMARRARRKEGVG